VGQSTAGVDIGQCPRREGRAGSCGQLRQVELPHRAQSERLGDSKRPVPELRLGREQLDAHTISRQRPQSQGSLECRNAAAGDNHPNRICASFH
jgi:hypothetical protein